MDIQTIIVAIIIFIALTYVGKMIFDKLKSFSTKSDCGNNCGCGEKSMKVLTQIHRN